jgi:hypothetical protein
MMVKMISSRMYSLLTRHTLVVFVGIVFLGWYGCGDSPAAPPGGGGSGSDELSFQQHILPIFSQYGCAGCHGGTSGLSVHTVQGLLVGGDHGPAIISGNADSSILIRKVSPTPPFGSRMPLGGPYLPDSTIARIAKWIDEGAKNN